MHRVGDSNAHAHYVYARLGHHVMHLRFEYPEGDDPKAQAGSGKGQVSSISLQNFFPITTLKILITDDRGEQELRVLVSDWLFALTRGINHVFFGQPTEFREWMFVDACEFVLKTHGDDCVLGPTGTGSEHVLLSRSQLVALHDQVRTEWVSAAKAIYGEDIVIEDLDRVQILDWER